MANITINEKEYEVPVADFNAICDLEALGVNILGGGNTPINDIRGIAAWLMGTSKDKAGSELQKHLLKGGNFEEIASVFEKEMTESPFVKAASLGIAPTDHKRKARKATAE